MPFYLPKSFSTLEKSFYFSSILENKKFNEIFLFLPANDVLNFDLGMIFMYFMYKKMNEIIIS